MALLAWGWLAAFYHPIGDSYTENDFYGGYAAGADALRHGVLDPHRYAAYGPVYEVTLALARGPGWDAFTCAKFLSVLAAAGTLACWLAILLPELGPLVSALALLFVAVTPVFTRYAYSATTDMLAVFLASLSIAIRWRRSGPGASATAGALAALAALTRYQMIFVALAGLLPLFPRSGVARERGVAAELVGFAAGFLALIAPWTWFACAHGAPPAAALVQHYGFYAASDASRNYQDAAGAPPDSLGWDAASSFARVAARDPGALLRLWARHAWEHLGFDARILVGPWLGGLALAGVLILLVDRRLRGIGAIAALGLIAHLALVPVFYSHRYRLPLLPFECALAATALAWLFARGARARLLAAALAAVAVATLTARNVAAQRQLHLELPRDVLALAPRLREERDTLRVVSRRGHIGYYADRLITPFPRVDRLSALADAAREGGAGYLYYSWYEARLRPEFLYLLDSTASVPGLERLAQCDQPPAILYRIGPRFGEEPAWLADSYQRRVHEARAAIRIYPDAEAAPARAVLAADTLLTGHPREALAMAREARSDRPDLSLAWQVEGAALQMLGDSLGARAALDRAARAAGADTLPTSRSGAPPPVRR